MIHELYLRGRKREMEKGRNEEREERDEGRRGGEGKREEGRGRKREREKAPQQFPHCSLSGKPLA